MPIYTKATFDQKSAYADIRVSNPLAGFVKVGTTLCPVEWLREGDGVTSPKYEVIAPDGFTFEPQGLHTLLCFSVKDISVRVDGNLLEKCLCEDCEAIRAGEEDSYYFEGGV